MSRLLVRGALDEMHRSLLAEGAGRPVLSMTSGELAIVARRVTKGVLLFRRARLDLHALDALRDKRQLRYGDVDSIVAMHVEEEVDAAPELHAAVTATLVALERMPLPSTAKSGAVITVTAFGAEGESLSRSFHENSEPALLAAIRPLLLRMRNDW